MRTGLVAVTKDKKYAETLICAGDSTDCSVEDLENYLEEYDLMYFDEGSGARRTGTVNLCQRAKPAHLNSTEAEKRFTAPIRGSSTGPERCRERKT